MSKRKSRTTEKEDKRVVEKQTLPARNENKWMPWVKHLAVYVFLLIASMLYFKPAAFEGKSLQQHDNQQSIQMQTESTQYRESNDYHIRWTNQLFGGMPTAIYYNQNKNYINNYVVAPTRLFQTYNEWICLFLIMLGCYIGLMFLGVDFVTAAALSLVLGFFTANTLYISAGHTGKMNVLATVPMVIGALIYAYKRNLMLGASVFALSLSINFLRNHIQITYYMLFAMVFIGLFFFIDAIKKNELQKFGKFAGVMILASFLGLLSNLGLLWPNYEYGAESTRGKTELAKKDHQEGLPKGYVFGLSFEKMETASLMFPNFYGGTQSKSFYSDPNSSTYKAVTAGGVQQDIVGVAKSNGWDSQEFMNQVLSQYTRQYRGSQTMSGGPIYYGAVVCFLFILALFLMQGALKWGILSCLLFFLALAWGEHFAFFNDLMFDYFPLYNKFRDTKMTLLVAQPIVILAIGLGLKELINFDAKKYENTWGAKLLPRIKQDLSKRGYVLLAGAVALSLCAFVLLYSMMTTPGSPKDVELIKISPTLLAALQADRSAMIQADALRAIGFIGAALLALFLYTKGTINHQIAMVAVAVIACVDLGQVNSDYLFDEMYVDNSYTERAELTPTKADMEIMADKTYFRVADYSQGPPSQSARACVFHKSMGGYFAAKPLLYQELWNGYNMDDGQNALKYGTTIFNMLNVKYFILSPDRKAANPTALGHAWFVENITQVDSAHQELEAIGTLSPQTTAIIQKKYAKSLEGLVNTPTPTDRIYLKKYHPDTMTYVSETTNERFVVFSEMYYPPSKGWSVYINDKKVEGGFTKVNYVLRGMRIPKGKNIIKMIYEPTSQIFGAQLSGICSWIIILLTLFSIYRHYTVEEEKEEITT
jgi:hypothetical protein